MVQSQNWHSVDVSRVTKQGLSPADWVYERLRV